MNEDDCLCPSDKNRGINRENAQQFAGISLIKSNYITSFVVMLLF